MSGSDSTEGARSPLDKTQSGHTLGGSEGGDVENNLNMQSEWVPEPEDFIPTPRKPVGLFQRWPATKHAVLPVALFIAAALLSYGYWTGQIIDLSISGNTFFRGEVWRAASALLAHADEAHLLSNGLLFIVFGTLLRAYFGFLAFPILPLIAGIVANIIVVSVYESHIRLLGVSGMIYAMVAIWLMFYLRFETDKSITRRVLRVVGFALLMLFPQTYDQRVSHLAHSSGFVSGVLVAAIALPYMKLRDPRV